MKLHYKKEHISCTNYKSESYEGFGIGTLTSGSNFNSQTLSVKTNFLIFILEGEDYSQRRQNKKGNSPGILFHLGIIHLRDTGTSPRTLHLYELPIQ